MHAVCVVLCTTGRPEGSCGGHIAYCWLRHVMLTARLPPVRRTTPRPGWATRTSLRHPAIRSSATASCTGPGTSGPTQWWVVALLPCTADTLQCAAVSVARYQPYRRTAALKRLKRLRQTCCCRHQLHELHGTIQRPAAGGQKGIMLQPLAESLGSLPTSPAPLPPPHLPPPPAAGGVWAAVPHGPSAACHVLCGQAQHSCRG